MAGQNNLPEPVFIPSNTSSAPQQQVQHEADHGSNSGFAQSSTAHTNSNNGRSSSSEGSHLGHLNGNGAGDYKMDKGNHEDGLDNSGVSPEYQALLQYIGETNLSKRSGGDDGDEKTEYVRKPLTFWKKTPVRVDRAGNRIKDTGARVTPAEWYV